MTEANAERFPSAPFSLLSSILRPSAFRVDLLTIVRLVTPLPKMLVLGLLTIVMDTMMRVDLFFRERLGVRGY